MKNLFKNICLTIILLHLSNCGFGNNLLLIGYNFTAVGPHKHRVTEKVEKLFPENGLSIISLNFKINDGKDGTNTIWRKINSDGTFGERITLTYVEAFKRGRVRVALDPGTYFLDGIRYPDGRKYIEAGAFRKMYSKEQVGWDIVKKEPLWFSFKAEAGKEMLIPDVLVSTRCEGGSYTCRGDDVLINMTIEGPRNKFNKNYKVGYLSKNK